MLLGCGGVGSCTLAMLATLADFDLSKLTIIDQSDAVTNHPTLLAACARGATFHQISITRDNWRSLLHQHVYTGDIIIDLTFGVSSIDVLEWCQHHRVGYINTAIERWEDELIPENNAKWLDQEKGEKSGEKDWTVAHKELYDRTLYARHQEIVEKEFAANGPTAVLEHGANPGLVSHFVRAALDNIVSSALQEVPGGALAMDLRKWQNAGNYPRIAMALGLRVVHISEIDTQTTTRHRPEGTFVNTWSPMGFAEEALDWVQVGWGTHERPLPRMLQPNQGPCNQVFVPMHAMDLTMHSYVPFTPIKGMCIPHGEADTITEHLSVYETGAEGDLRAVYRPSVYYVYQCADVAMESLDEMRNRDYIPQTEYHVLVPKDGGLQGEDRVGVLLMFDDEPVRVLRGETENKTPWSFWHGSILSDTNNLVRNFNPTVVQVAASVVAAYKWAKEHPSKGVCWPDDIPHKYILDLALPFLGTMVSAPMTEYKPPPSLQFSDFICSS